MTSINMTIGTDTHRLLRMRAARTGLRLTDIVREALDAVAEDELVHVGEPLKPVDERQGKILPSSVITLDREATQEQVSNFRADIEKGIDPLVAAAKHLPGVGIGIRAVVAGANLLDDDDR